MPLGIVEGRLVEISAQSIQLVLADGRTLACDIDGRTYMDRDRARLQAKDLKAGDFLELVTERQSPRVPCFARMIHVSPIDRRFGGNATAGAVQRTTESFAPRGGIGVTGVVRDLQPKSLEIKTRHDGILRFRLRPDTVFLCDGLEVPAAEVDRTRPVFVRAGYSLAGEIEVYQVAWGALVQPPTPLPRPPIKPL